VHNEHATVLDAKLYCESSDKCAGFTFINDKTKDKQQMFFKGIGVGKAMGDGEGNWQTYLKSDDALEEMRELANSGGKPALDDKQRSGKPLTAVKTNTQQRYSAVFDLTKAFTVTLVNQRSEPVDVYRLKEDGGDGGTAPGITGEWELLGTLLRGETKRVRRTKQGRKLRFATKGTSAVIVTIRIHFIQRYYLLKGEMKTPVKTLGDGDSPVAYRYRNLQAVARDLYYWDTGSETHTKQHTMQPDEQTTTVAYKGHVFYWAPVDKPEIKLKEMEIVHNTDNFFVLLPTDKGGDDALVERAQQLLRDKLVPDLPAGEKLAKQDSDALRSDYENEANFREEYQKTKGGSRREQMGHGWGMDGAT
jgi:hypothetical protein